MARKNIHSNLLGIIILISGVIIGVILVGQAQYFRNKAKEVPPETYTICHKTGNSENPWEEITVNKDELSQRINDGDIFGECPEGN